MRHRLDYILVERGIAKSRSRARDLILRGAVTVDGRLAEKPGQLAAAEAEIAVDADANRFVARSGAKLLAGLEAFGFDAGGVQALDVGASTGGFTEVLLENGAASVYAIDVGREQLDGKLAGDPRVVSLEGRDIRGLSQTDVPQPVQAIVIDVSFISLAAVLPKALSFAGESAWLIALFKPQFEVGREAIGKNGIVRDVEAVASARGRIETTLADLGWRSAGWLPSPLPGKKGNEEWLIGAELG